MNSRLTGIGRRHTMRQGAVEQPVGADGAGELERRRSTECSTDVRGPAMVEKSVALDIVSSNPWSAIVLSSDGQVAEVVAFSGEPTAEAFLDFTRTHVRGRRFRLIRGALTEAQLDALIADIMRSVTPKRALESGGPKVPEWESSLNPFSAARCIADAIADFVTRRSG